MNDFDPQVVEEAMDEAQKLAEQTLDEAQKLTTSLSAISPEFKGEIYFSTDGKHTVHIEAQTPEGRRAGGLWALETYRWIAKELGTKAQMWDKAMNGKKEEKAPEKTGEKGCSHEEGFEILVSNSEKNKGKQYKKCKACGDFLGWYK